MDDITPQLNQAPSEQDIRKKKIRNILLLSILILLVLGGIYFLYIFLTKGKVAPEGGTFPIGGNVIEQGASDIPKGESPTQGSGSGVGVEAPKLIEIYNGPLAGYTILPNGYTIRGFDRAKGRLVEININTGVAKVMSDQPILQVHDGIFLSDASLILRSLDNRDTIKTRLYTIVEQQGNEYPLTLNGPIALADNILEYAASPNKQKVVLVIKDPLGANIDVLDVATQKLVRQATLPLTEWIPAITNNGTVYLSAKASRYAKSGTYRIEKGGLVLSVKANTGQTTLLSPEGDVAYSAALFGDQFTAEIRESTPDSSRDPTILPFAAIAEKCAWTSDTTILYCGASDIVYQNTPDDWYKGITQSSDSLWLYNLPTHTEKFLVNPVNFKTSIDMVSLLPTQTAVYFKNRTNDHLWMYKLNGTAVQTSSETGAETTITE
ncbi:MAG TPA: hypothetical protein VJ579_01810 [Candidatus Paceibacterota bacterium]|nr:hypothetical protein [Candidatus Paceibacterota bacterium]